MTLCGEPVHKAVGTAALLGLWIALPATAGYLLARPAEARRAAAADDRLRQPDRLRTGGTRFVAGRAVRREAGAFPRSAEVVRSLRRSSCCSSRSGCCIASCRDSGAVGGAPRRKASEMDSSGIGRRCSPGLRIRWRRFPDGAAHRAPRGFPGGSSDGHRRATVPCRRMVSNASASPTDDVAGPPVDECGGRWPGCRSRSATGGDLARQRRRDSAATRTWPLPWQTPASSSLLPCTQATTMQTRARSAQCRGSAGVTSNSTPPSTTCSRIGKVTTASTRSESARSGSLRADSRC